MVQDGIPESVHIENLQRERGAEGEGEREGSELRGNPKSAESHKEYILFFQHILLAQLQSQALFKLLVIQWSARQTNPWAPRVFSLGRMCVPRVCDWFVLSDSDT